MGATLTTVNALLKEVYEKDVQDQLNSDVVGFKRIERTSEGVTNEVGGRYVTFPLRVGRNAGIGARQENEALPTPGQQKTTAARVSVKYLYGGISLTGQVMKLADDNYQAFASALDEEITGLKRDLAKDVNFQFYGNGTGVRATATVAGAAVNTMTVDKIQYLEIGMMIDIVPAALGAPIASNRQITAINTATNVITFSGAAATFAIGDVVIRTGNTNRELTGLGAIVNNTGVLYNVDPAVENSWKSVVNANGGTPRALTEALMIKVVDDVRVNGGEVTVGFTNLGVRRAYFNLLKTDRRFVNTQAFEGGFTGLAFTTDKGDIPIVVDVDCPFNKLFFVNEKAIKLYRQADWAWMDEDGNKFQRVIGFDSYEARMFQYCEMGTHRRNSHGLLSDITEG